MKNLGIFAATLVVALFVESAKADTAGGSLAVTGAITSSISLTIDQVEGPAPIGQGTDTVSTAFGSIGRFVAPPAGTQIYDEGGNEWFVYVGGAVTVYKSNLAADFLTLRARLASAAPAGVRFFINSGSPLTTSDLVVTANGYFDLPMASTVEIGIMDTFTGGAIANTIIYTATSN